MVMLARAILWQGGHILSGDFAHAGEDDIGGGPQGRSERRLRRRFQVVFENLAGILLGGQALRARLSGKSGRLLVRELDV